MKTRNQPSTTTVKYIKKLNSQCRSTIAFTSPTENVFKQFSKSDYNEAADSWDQSARTITTVINRLWKVMVGMEDVGKVT